MDHTNPNHRQVAGTHYSAEDKSKFQHWDFVHKALCGQYLEGCASKYVSRWRHKNGLADLEKCQHYIEKLLWEFTRRDRIFRKSMDTLHFEASGSAQGRQYALLAVEEFAHYQQLTDTEKDICRILATWSNAEELQQALSLLHPLIDHAQALHDEVEQMKQDNP